ncbi:MAG: hypothetical protein J3K34DRAFT_481655 [Monoraphidium minutum]|nr:MAG: hypothetical protein J3K34DRAFT_481655 [Monoraphidium minutum]
MQDTRADTDQYGAPIGGGHVPRVPLSKPGLVETWQPQPAPAPVLPGRPLPVGRMPAGLHIEVTADEAARAARAAAGAGAAGAGALLRRVAQSRAARAAARVLISGYFFNAAYTAIETWRILTSDPQAAAALRRWASDPATPAPRFPWLHAALLAPAAAVALWPRPLVWPAAALLAFTAWEDGGMALRQIRGVLLHGSRPTELLVKPLAICGATALLLAAAVREARRARSGAWAGPLSAGDDDDAAATGAGAGGARVRRPRRSALLLVGRVLMVMLLAFAGWMQAQRVAARAAALPGAAGAGAAQHYGRADPHDSPLVLLECALGALLALGLATRPAAAALAATLAAEALSSWRFWGPAPNFAYRQHAREHFFVAFALAGGALLLSALGAGGFAVDTAIAARKRQ